MMTRFNDNVAMVAGINAAIIAELIYRLLDKESSEIVNEYEKKWCRCSIKMATVHCPYFSRHQVEHALNVLRDKGIISKENLNTSKFDHTNWYAFTEYGSGLIDIKG